MTQYVLTCRECSTRKAFGSPDAAVTSDWEDIETDGHLDDNDIVWHDATCAGCAAEAEEEEEEAVEIDVETPDEDDDDEPEPETDGGWVPAESDPVDVAQADLPRSPPRHEHDRGTIKRTNVDPKKAIEAYKQSTPATPIEAILQRHFGRVHGPDEVRVYHDLRKNEEATFHHVQFPSGAQGVYPERCLVPAPEVALRGDDDGAG